VRIRDFQIGDVDAIVEILKLNGQYAFSEVDGPEAMRRVKACKAAVFLVCEVEGRVVGVVRGNFDCSRAIIHQLSVHPAYQKRGIGAALVREIVERLREKGAPTVSAMVHEKSVGFGRRLGLGGRRFFLLATGDFCVSGFIILRCFVALF
jgi:predicted N-acetyltransferase YhbS